MRIMRFTFAMVALPLLALAAFSRPAHASPGMHWHPSVWFYEFGDVLIPEVMVAEVEPIVLLDQTIPGFPPPSLPREFVLPEPTPFQNLWRESEQRWTDDLWFFIQRCSSHRPVGRWEDLFTHEFPSDVVFLLRRGMTVAEADQVLTGYYQEKSTELMPGMFRIQPTRQTNNYVIEKLWLVVRFEDGRLCGFKQQYSDAFPTRWY